MSNAITDASRLAGIQGDGLLNDSSFGSWGTSTNLCTNGGFETNTTGWVGEANVSVAPDITWSKFGFRSVKITKLTNGVAGAGFTFNVSGLTIGVVYTISGWMMGTATTCYLLCVGIGGSTPGAISSTPKKVTFTFTATGTSHNVGVQTGGGLAGEIVFLDGFQIELGSIATPYIETDGGAATRDASFITAPSTMLNKQQGWAAFRVRMGWASTVGTRPGDQFPGLMFWKSVDSSSSILVFVTSGAINLKVVVGGVATTRAFNKAWALGDSLTIIIAWETALLKVSVDGGIFQTVTLAAPITATMESTFYLLRGDSTNNQLFGDGKWIAMGSGVLTDNDIADINCRAVVATLISPTLRNGGFETLGIGGADVFSVWNEVTAGGSTVVADAIDKIGGAYSAQLNVGISTCYVLNSVGTTIGAFYRVQFWGKVEAGGSLQFRENGGSTPFDCLSITWVYLHFSYKAVSGSGIYFTHVSGNNLKKWVDEVTLEQIDPDADTPIHSFPGHPTMFWPANTGAYVKRLGY